MLSIIFSPHGNVKVRNKFTLSSTDFVFTSNMIYQVWSTVQNQHYQPLLSVKTQQYIVAFYRKVYLIASREIDIILQAKTYIWHCIWFTCSWFITLYQLTVVISLKFIFDLKILCFKGFILSVNGNVFILFSGYMQLQLNNRDSTHQWSI